MKFCNLKIYRYFDVPFWSAYLEYLSAHDLVLAILWTPSLCRMMMHWLFWWSILYWYLFHILFELSQRGNFQLLTNLIWRDQLVKQFMSFRGNLQLSTLPAWMWVYIVASTITHSILHAWMYAYILPSSCNILLKRGNRWNIFIL